MATSPAYFLPRITIKKFDASATYFTHDGWSPPGSGARVISCFCEDKQNEPAPFEIRIEDNGNALDANVGNRNLMTFEIGTSAPAYEGFVSGYVTNVEPDFKDTNARVIILRGFTLPIRWEERILNFYRIAARQGDTADPDLTDTTMKASELFKDVHQDADVYPFGGPFLPFTMDNVQDTSDTLASVRKPFSTMKSIIDSLGDSIGASYGVGYDLKAYFRYATFLHSGLRLQGVKDDTLILPDATTGYFVGPWSYSLSTAKKDGFANRLIGKGGTEYLLDIDQMTNNSQIEFYTVDRAAQFIPKKVRLDGLKLILSKVGTPLGDITGSIVQDKSNKPEGDEVGTFSIFANLVGTSATKIPRVNLTMNNRSLQVDKAYWIILNKQGDASNYYRWHHDNGSSGVNASRSGGVWTTNTSSFAFDMQTFRSRQVVSVMGSSESIVKYDVVEDVVDAPWIVERQSMDILLTSILRWSAMQKMLFSPNKIWAPTTVIHPGQLIQVVEPRTSLDINAEINRVRYTFDFQANKIGTRFVDLELVGFTP